jgi:hypothetical protein
MNRPEQQSDEGLFDFITNQDFKENLKSDYAELVAAVKGACGKPPTSLRAASSRRFCLTT